MLYRRSCGWARLGSGPELCGCSRFGKTGTVYAMVIRVPGQRRGSGTVFLSSQQYRRGSEDLIERGSVSHE
jgi:hypothetical protein